MKIQNRKICSHSEIIEPREWNFHYQRSTWNIFNTLFKVYFFNFFIYIINQTYEYTLQEVQEFWIYIIQ